MLIDSRAKICAISEQYQEQILKYNQRTPKIPVTELCLYNAVGDKPTKVSTQMLLPIDINKEIVQTPFIVIKNLNEKDILGSEFLDTHRASIDFHKRTLIIKHQ